MVVGGKRKSAKTKMRRRADRDYEYNLMEEAVELGEQQPVPQGQIAEQKSNIKGDEKNIAILLFLYLLQGIPLGLCSSIPMLLQNRGVSYRQQAEFSFVMWPFSMKLLWAPIVDAVFIPKFGRRKTWLLPIQYIMGIFMLYLSKHVDNWLGKTEGHELNIGLLTVLFFALNVLAATQDIVVDGWALTMLKRCNVGYASTCNSVGQTAGFFLGYVILMAFESPAFCNAYLRSVPSDEGLITLPGFLYFWGCIFIVATTFIGIFKREDAEACPKDESLNIKESYQMLWSTMKLPNIKLIILILLTSKIGFSASDAVTGLKMVEAGIPKEKIALMAVPLIPLQILLPIFISKYTAGPKSMNVFLKALPYRLIFGLVGTLLVWVTPYFVSNGEVPLYFFGIIIALYLLHQVCASCMFVAAMAFFARISDPAVGGTYMTFLNTLSNLGGNWPSTAALYFVDSLTSRQCSNDITNICGSDDQKAACALTGGTCKITLDGYYIESILCVIIGFVWLRWGKRKIQYLQDRPLSTWKVVRQKS
ncbi:acetyl-coenzyme A transporter 1 [Trichogramma pretiosum]|uniref:acetyl-coenzyme A transporter 1 n=1 Tax=Trichogramma pretiosum TaxID=7493 RepID=UPI0006C9AB6E|nr:acetyl-coenzyme A transporter 1 [Trichogramma pretiosum]